MHPPEGVKDIDDLTLYLMEGMSKELSRSLAEFLLMDFFDDGTYILRPTERLETVYWGISEIEVISISEDKLIIKELYDDEYLGVFDKISYISLIDENWILTDLEYEYQDF